jgi:secernin
VFQSKGINEYRVAIGNEAIYTKTFRDAAQAYQSGHSPALGLLGMDQLEREFAAEVPEVWRGYVAAGWLGG